MKVYKTDVVYLLFGVVIIIKENVVIIATIEI